jgi:hypothetical protein
MREQIDKPLLLVELRALGLAIKLVEGLGVSDV